MKFIRFTPLEIQSTLEYWTDERMANAIPMPLLSVELPERIQQTDDEFSQAETEMFCFGSEENRRFHPLYAAKVNVNLEPYNKAGKLFFTRADGQDYYGTAQFVGADNIILTVAHCLKASGGKWSTNIMFRRAYRGTVADQHLNVVVSALGIHNEWDESGVNRIKWDYAFAETTKPSNVGHLTLSTTLPEKLKSIGYPINYGLNTKYMCEGRGTRGRYRNGIVIMQGNFMQGGASGGAWFERDGLKEVVGIHAGNVLAINEIRKIAQIQAGNFVEMNPENYATGNVYGPVFDKNTTILMNKMIDKNSIAKKNKNINLF